MGHFSTQTPQPVHSSSSFKLGCIKFEEVVSFFLIDFFKNSIPFFLSVSKKSEQSIDDKGNFEKLVIDSFIYLSKQLQSFSKVDNLPACEKL